MDTHAATGRWRRTATVATAINPVAAAAPLDPATRTRPEDHDGPVDERRNARQSTPEQS